MKFSIIIPTFENYEYLKLCIDSIKKNSKYNHEIIVHVNGNDLITKKYLSEMNIIFTQSSTNIGLCSSVNLASKKATTDYILYSHDDMYYLPKWDDYLTKEINSLSTKLFYLSLTQISYTGSLKSNLQHIEFNCGNHITNFNEKKLLDNFDRFRFRNLQGSHWAPHIVHKDIWNFIGGFSEEFNPGFASDPDLNMKLWLQGVRIFKGISKSRVYHFGSLTTRKKKQVRRNNGKKTFLLKWKMTVDFFVKHYLKRGDTYNYPLTEPTKNFNYYIDFLLSKTKYHYTKML